MSDFTRIEDKLEKIQGYIGKQAITLERLTVSVEEHVRRSNLLEERMKPIEEHVNLVDAGVKIVVGLSVVATIIEVFLHFMGK